MKEPFIPILFKRDKKTGKVPRGVTAADLDLSPEEIKELVTGAQKYLPPETEDGEPIPTTPNGNQS